MKWIKKGLIYKPEKSYEWMQSHAQVPFPYKINDKLLRIYFATRDAESCSSVTFIDVEPSDPSKIIYEHVRPCISKGELGNFDDSGTMPSWFIKQNSNIHLFYTGWNRSNDISYRISIGLAISKDNGITFTRLFNGPILDRSKYDPIWVAQPSVLIEGKKCKMWYLSCQKVEYINNHPEPFYNVKYSESLNGVDWEPAQKPCIDFDNFTDAIGRPFVYKDEGIYKMLYSYRSAKGYRIDPNASYRIGYAKSIDGLIWERKDESIEFNGETQGWDSIMQAYPCTYEHKGRRYLIYNGNAFGQSGFGYAVLENH